MRKRRVFRVICAIFAMLLFAGGAAFAAVPGPHKVLIASYYGFQPIAPNVLAPAKLSKAKQTRLLHHIESGRKRIADYFGELHSNPKIVLCPHTSCDSMLGAKGPRGVAYGSNLIVLRQKGLNETIATHELAHIELHKRMGIWALHIGRIPGWFDEGLATLLSGDPRFKLDATPDDIAWIKNSKTIWDWKRFATATEWKRAYNSAATAVHQLEQKIGRDALRRAISVSLNNGIPLQEALQSERK